MLVDVFHHLLYQLFLLFVDTDFMRVDLHGFRKLVAGFLTAFKQAVHFLFVVFGHALAFLFQILVEGEIAGCEEQQ